MYRKDRMARLMLRLASHPSAQSSHREAPEMPGFAGEIARLVRKWLREAGFKSPDPDQAQMESADAKRELDTLIETKPEIIEIVLPHLPENIARTVRFLLNASLSQDEDEEVLLSA